MASHSNDATTNLEGKTLFYAAQRSRLLRAPAIFLNEDDAAFFCEENTTDWKECDTLAAAYAFCVVDDDDKNPAVVNGATPQQENRNDDSPANLRMDGGMSPPTLHDDTDDALLNSTTNPEEIEDNRIMDQDGGEAMAASAQHHQGNLTTAPSEDQLQKRKRRNTPSSRQKKKRAPPNSALVATETAIEATEDAVVGTTLRNDTSQATPAQAAPAQAAPAQAAPAQAPTSIWNTSRFQHWIDHFEDYCKGLEEYERTHNGAPFIASNAVNKKQYTTLCHFLNASREYCKAHRATPGPSSMQNALNRLQTMGYRVGQRGWRRLDAMAKFEDNFETHYQRLLAFQEQHGHCQVTPLLAGDTYADLLPWIGTARKFLALYQKDPQDFKPSMGEKMDRVQALGLLAKLPRGRPARKEGQPSEEQEERWETMFSKLQEYKREHGHVDVPSNPQTALRGWIGQQKHHLISLKEGKSTVLTPERLVRLTELGLSLSLAKRVTWEERAFEWLEYRGIHGKDPPRTTETGIGKWCTDQRFKYMKKKQGQSTNLTDEQIAKLTGWGFDWREDRKPKRKPESIKSWEERFQELVEYAQIHGTTSVPQTSSVLGDYVHRQRHECKKSHSFLLRD